MHTEANTYLRHAAYSALRGPAIALTTSLASFVALKSFNATDDQVILISFAMPAANFLAFFWTRFMAGRRSIPFAFWPDLFGFLILLPVAFRISTEAFIAIMMMTTILRSSTIVALSTIIRDNYRTEARASILARVQAWSLAAQAVAGYFFGSILKADPNAYRYLFPLTALLGIAALWYLRGVPEEEPSSRKVAAQPSFLDFFHVLKRDPDFLRYQASTFVHGFAAIMYTAVLPLYLANELKVDYKVGAMALVVITTVPTIFTGVLWAKLIDRANILIMRGSFNFAMAMGPLIIFIFRDISGVYVSQLIVALITGGSSLIWNLGNNLYAKRHEVATYMGIHQTLTGVRGFIAPALGIWIAGIAGGSGAPNYHVVFFIASIMMIAAGAMMFSESRAMARRGRPVTFRGAEKHVG